LVDGKGECWNAEEVYEADDGGARDRGFDLVDGVERGGGADNAARISRRVEFKSDEGESELSGGERAMRLTKAASAKRRMRELENST